MMQWFILAALALTAATALWYLQAAGGDPPASPPEEEGEAFRRWLDAPGNLAEMERAVDALTGLMAHPELGGPGFLTVRLPQPGEDGCLTMAAQYPNIREVLYRRIVRRELHRDGLLEAGMAETLLALAPAFETDSGGVVVVTLRTAAMEPELVNRLSGRRERQAALEQMAVHFSRRFPALEVRPFGVELLLAPIAD